MGNYSENTITTVPNELLSEFRKKGASDFIGLIIFSEVISCLKCMVLRSSRPDDLSVSSSTVLWSPPHIMGIKLAIDEASTVKQTYHRRRISLKGKSSID